MNFLQAIQAMKEGKKVKRPLWSGDSAWKLDKSRGNGNFRIIDEFNYERKPQWYNCDATDWEIVKETLSDHIDYRPAEFDDGISTVGRLIATDVKKSLKEFIDYLTEILGKPTLQEKAEEIFGKELI